MNYKDVINSKGLKTTWIAKQLGVSRQLLSMFIHGNRNMKSDKVKELHKILNI